MRKFLIRGLHLLTPVFNLLNIDVHITTQVPVSRTTCKSTGRDFFVRDRPVSTQIAFHHPRTP